MKHAAAMSVDVTADATRDHAAPALDRGESPPPSMSLSEGRRNRLLRRVDWRFLLPNPHPSRAVCLSSGLLAEAVGLTAEHMVEPAAARGCDLAVAVDPDAKTLDAAVAALRPGGACYTEWYSPLSGGLTRIRRRLRQAGLTDVTFYWAWPPPARGTAAFWLPIESPAAVRYFLAGRPTPRTATARALAHAQRFLWRAGWAAGRLLPICAVARKPLSGEGDAAPGGSAGAADLWAFVRDGWTDWGLGPPPNQLSWLLLTPGLRSINKPVALVFADAAEPGIAIKMARVPEAAPSLARERAVLTGLQTMQPPGLPGVPRVVFYTVASKSAVLGETIIDGTPIFTQLRPDNYHAIAAQATDWLAGLAGRPVPAARHTWWERLILPVLDRFQAAFGAVVDAALIEQTRSHLAALAALPLTCEQRDFSPWNVLLGPDGRLAVLDWESAEVSGLPALDLLYFLTYLAFYRDGAMASGHFKASYAASLNPSTPTGAVRSACLARYCSHVGLEPAALEALRPFVWLVHAEAEYSRFVADHGGTPPLETLRSSLFVALWEMECAAIGQGTHIHA
ncbi:MAG: hypothetical protein U0822_14560 [Anaerolineae bacterium]